MTERDYILAGNYRLLDALYRREREARQQCHRLSELLTYCGRYPAALASNEGFKDEVRAALAQSSTFPKP